MSYFSTELQRLLETMSGSRAGFATRVGIAASTFHNYYHGTTPPVVDDLEKISRVLEPSERVDLVIAHLRDQTPPSVEEFIRVVSLIKEPRAREATEEEYSKIKLSAKDRKNFEYLMKRASKHPAVGDHIDATVKLMQGL